MYPRIEFDLCEDCEVCVEVCPSEVYRTGENAVEVAFPEECIECGACVEQCPAECIVLMDG